MLADYNRAKAESPWVIESLCNGCGPQGLPWLRPYIPQAVFREAGNRHDWDYTVGGGENARFEADLRFGLACMEASLQCRWGLLLVYVPLAALYFVLVRRFGYKGPWYYTEFPRLHEEMIELAADKMVNEGGFHG